MRWLVLAMLALLAAACAPAAKEIVLVTPTAIPPAISSPVTPTAVPSTPPTAPRQTATSVPPTATPRPPAAPAPATAPPPPSADGIVYPCEASDCNCSDFPSHAEAQRVFEKHGGSPANNWSRLDGNDHDGIACESLP